MSDFIRECNEFKISEGDFTQAWCSRCLREDCDRGIKGVGRFEARTRSWRDRFFTNTPKLAETDPRYPTIVAKSFQEIGKPLEVRGWDEPSPPIVVEASPQPAPQVVGSTKLPNQAGRVLGTAPTGWSPKESVIRPGTRIRLAPSGVGSGDGSENK